jgi:hypothetical protein
VGEQVGVGLADQGAEGLPEVGEPAVTDQPAQMVQVAGGVGGGDMGQQLAAAFPAALGQLDRLGQVAPLLGPLAGVGKQVTGALAPAPPRMSQPTMSKRPW